MKLSHLATALLGALLVPASALAQAESAPAAGASLAVGATVYDPQGGEVGTIESVSGDSVVLNTGTNKATLPKTAFGSGSKGPTVNATKAQVDAAVAQAAAKATAARDAALVPGAAVHGKAGSPVGTVKEVTGDNVILDRPGGAVTLTRQFFTAGANGLSLTLTAAELDAAAKAASASEGTAQPATNES
jgi:hypothetical protein